MDINEYLKKHGLNDTQLAKICGMSQSFLYRIRHGQTSPSMETAAKIVRATRGEVSADDLMRTTVKHD